jgi:hypothetical protein
MKTLSKIVTLSTVSLMLAAPVAGIAASQAAKTKTDATSDQQPTVLRASAEAMNGMQSLHEARMALFDGETDTGRELVQTALDAFQGDIAAWEIAGTDAANPDAKLVPIQTSLSVTEGFVLTDAHKPALTVAGKAMGDGDQQGALQALLEASIDTSVQAALLPVDATVSKLKSALSDIDAGKFYEANLALKSIEQSVVIETFGAGQIPQQGAESTSAS